MLGVVGCFIVLAVRFLCISGLARPFCHATFLDPATFNAHRILGATSFAALTYIGFDGITTLTRMWNPKPNILLATVFVCVFTGIFGGLEVYLGQRVWPDWHSFTWLKTAFMDVCGRVGGPLLSMPWRLC